MFAMFTLGTRSRLEARMTRAEAVAIIEAHNAGHFTGRYSDWVHAGGVIYEDEMNRRAAANGPVGTIDTAPGKRHRTHDSGPTHIHVHIPTGDQGVLGSGPELKGARPGNVGASEAWPSDPPILPLEGKAEDYQVLDNPAGGCGLFRRASKDRKARTGDKFTWGQLPMVKQRDTAQHSILKGINAANAEAWAKPEAQGKW
jgi:hypothetical protein